MSLFWLQSQAYMPAGTATSDVGGGGTAATFADTVIALTPTAYWRFGEASGSTAVDQMSTYNATIGGAGIGYGTAGWANDGDTALTFASAAYVTYADNAAWDFGTGDFSIMFAAKTTEAWSTRTLLGHDGAGNVGQWEVYTEAIADMIRLNIRDITGTSTNYSFYMTTDLFDDGSWHLYVLTVDRDSASGGRLYVDGSLMGSALDVSATSAYDVTSTRPLYIGARNTSGSDQFVGSIDEVAIWKGTALSATNVTDMYNAGTS